MKQSIIILGTVLIAATLTYCSGSKKAAAAKPVVAYSTDIVPIMQAQCAPCHIPAKGGNKKAYDNYANVKADIDDILVRIQLDSTDKRFMPRKKPKLDAATISLLKQWKEGGMLEAKP